MGGNFESIDGQKKSKPVNQDGLEGVLSRLVPPFYDQYQVFIPGLRQSSRLP